METSLSVRARIQTKAKRVLAQLGETLTTSDTERSIAERAVALLLESGLSETWYHRCPALVLLGSRSALSISGRSYEPALEPVGDMNLVTVDISPCVGDMWGDCARSYAVENGRHTMYPKNPDFTEGLEIERRLHDLMMSGVTPDTRFCDLHATVSRTLLSWGWENLDFGLNFGHSIARQLDDRIYIDPTNTRRLGEAECFTFEPHVRRCGGRWGFKHEDIYYFDDSGHACVL